MPIKAGAGEESAREDKEITTAKLTQKKLGRSIEDRPST